MGIQKQKVKAMFLGTSTEGVGKALIKMPPGLETLKIWLRGPDGNVCHLSLPSAQDA